MVITRRKAEYRCDACGHKRAPGRYRVIVIVERIGEPTEEDRV